MFFLYVKLSTSQVIICTNSNLSSLHKDNNIASKTLHAESCIQNFVFLGSQNVNAFEGLFVETELYGC